MKTSLFTIAFLAVGARALVAQAPATPTSKPAAPVQQQGTAAKGPAPRTAAHAAVQQHIPKSGATTAPLPARQAPATAAPAHAAAAAAHAAVTQQGAQQQGAQQQGAQQQGAPARKGAAPAARATPAPAAAKGAPAAAVKRGAAAGAAAATAAKPAAPPARGAAPAKTTAAPAAPAAGAATLTATKAVKDTVVPRVLMREAFDYAPDGRRDPFVSLMNTSDLRPTISDLRLTGILYDLSGRRPVAVMRDVQTNAQYRVTTGTTLGRMRVARIKPKVIVFSIEEFGLSRQDSLVLGDTSRVRTK